MLNKAQVVWEMIIETLSSTDSWDSPAVQSPCLVPESLDKPPRVGGRQHPSGLVDDDQDMYRHRLPID